MTQHAFVQEKKARPSRSTICATSFDVEALSSRVHLCLTSCSWRHESPIAAHDALEVHVVEPHIGVSKHPYMTSDTHGVPPKSTH